VATTGAEATEPLATVRRIAQALAARGIAFVHWKSNGHLAEALAGLTDLDVYADPAAADSLRACLAEQGCLRILSQPWASYPDVEDWLAFDPATGRFIHLHLHFALVTGLRRVKHLRIPWGPALLAGRGHDLDPDWPTPAPEMELMILLVRMWAKMPPKRRLFGPRLPKHIRSEFDWLAARADAAKLADLARQLLPGVDAAAITGLLTTPPPSEAAVLAVSRRVYGALQGDYRTPFALALLAGAWLNLRAFAAKNLRRLGVTTITGKRVEGAGLTVAFIGSDGSGKSTLTREMRRWLRYKLDVHGVYMGSGQGSTRLTDRIRHAVKGKAKDKSKAKSSDAAPRPRREPGFLDRLLALHHLTAIRGKVRALKRARRLAADGSVVVLDRFPQSQVNGIYDGPRLQDGRGFAWAARAEMKAFAEVADLAPDLVVRLLVTPEISHARKPDHSFATLKRKAEITAALRFPQSKVVDIDSSAPLDVVILAAKTAVWQALRRRAAGESP